MPTSDDRPASVLTRAQEVTLSQVLECIHPQDDLGPGALMVGLPAYVLGQLEGDLRRLVPHYRAGLDSLEQLASDRLGVSFSTLASSAQEQLLRSVDDEEAGLDGQSTAKVLLDLAVEHAYEGLFGDPAYGGNVGGAGWRLVGYPGPRPVVPAGHQLLDVVVPASAESIFGVEMFAGRDRG